MRFPRVLKYVSAVVAAAMLLSGCQLSSPSQSNFGPQPKIDASIAPDLAPFYQQSVRWEPCGSEQTFCANIEVPADWNEPAGEKLKLALAYRKADNQKPIGSLIFNPGGPGSSGVSWITDSVDQLGTANLRKNFNMVGFDPRGVGLSEPRVTCLDSKDTNEFLYGETKFELGSAQDIQQTRNSLKKFTKACLENTGENLGQIGTVAAAKDLDVIRAIFGDEQINYLGYSYGTFLGATYAELFSARVGRMVLDGAINPLVTEDEQNISQLLGFDQALKNYLSSCLSSNECPFSTTVSGAEKQIAKLLREIEVRPLPTDSGRSLTVWAAVTGIIMPMYSTSFWPALNQAFEEAFNGDGTTLLALADVYNDRNEDGTFATNTLEANIAISCLDARQPADAKSIALQNKKVLAASETMGRYWQFGALTCEQWPFPVADRPQTYRAEGSNPILVVGTTGDPATPYSQAVSLANEVLENGHLLTFNGDGHTAYGQGSKCVNETVDAYLIQGVIPVEDPNCS